MVIGEKVNFEPHCQTKTKEISKQEKCLQSE